MSAIQGTDSNGECDIERTLAGLELEFLDCYLPYAHPPGGEFLSRGCSSLLNRLGRSVDREYMPVADALCDCTRCGTRTAPDLQYTDTRPQWQGPYDLGKPRRKILSHRKWAVVCVGALWTVTTAVAETTVVTQAAVAGSEETFAA